MTTHDRDKIIAAAKEAGFGALTPYGESCTEKLYAIAFDDGRKAEREDLSTIFGKLHTWLTNIAVVATIRARSKK